MLQRHSARLTYYGGFTDVPGVQTPPEQITLTVLSDVAERLNIITLYNEPNADGAELFPDILEIIDVDGLHSTRGSVIEIFLECDTHGFTDIIRLLTHPRIRKAIMEKLRIRMSFTHYFKMMAMEDSEENTWLDAVRRLDASAYKFFDDLLEELKD